MPNLIVIAVVGAGAYLGFRWIKNQIREAAITAAKEAAVRSPAPTPSERARDAGTLVWDEKAGVYRKKDG